MFILDTNVISEMRKGHKGDPNVVAWASKTDLSSMYVSVISLAEIETGVLLMENKDAGQGAILRKWLDDHVMKAFGNRIIDIDQFTAKAIANINVPNARPFKDSCIAASAMQHKMTVVTRNTKDFEGIKVNLINPWEQ